MMPKKEPILALAEEKTTSDETRRQRCRNRSPPPQSFFPDYPADGPESGIASAGKNVDKMSGCARARLKWCSRSWTMSMPGALDE